MTREISVGETFVGPASLVPTSAPSTKTSKDTEGFETDSQSDISDRDEGEEADYTAARVPQDTIKRVTQTIKVMYWDARFGSVDELKLAVLESDKGQGAGSALVKRGINVIGSSVQELRQQCLSYAKLAADIKDWDSQEFWTTLRDEIAVVSFFYDSRRNLGTSHEENGFKAPDPSLIPVGVQALED